MSFAPLSFYASFFPIASWPQESLTQQFGIPIFVSVIILGLGLIAWGVIAKREKHVRSRFITTGAALLCLMMAVVVQTKIDNERGFIADQEKRNDKRLKEITRKKGREEALKMQFMYMPAGDSLYYMTLGNPSLAADYVWLTSLQFVSNSFRRGEKFEMLSRFHNTMVDLDPHWVDAEINGGRVLSALIEEREKSELCFKRDIEKNWDNWRNRWRLRYEAGLLFVTPPNDPRKLKEFSHKSAEYFKAAIEDHAMYMKWTKPLKDPVEQARRQKAEDIWEKATNDRIARLLRESGSQFLQEAENLMAQNATASDTPESLREISRRDWLRARSMAQAAALTEEVARYRKPDGTYPPNLLAVTQEFLKHIPHPEVFLLDKNGYPLDAFDFRFDYDSKTGLVTSRGAKALHAIQAGHVINDLISVYRDNNQGENPKNLDQLAAYLANCNSPPVKPLSVMVFEAIGEIDPVTKAVILNPKKSPLGEWKYDDVKGEVDFPAECDAKALYGHINDYEWNPNGITRKR